MRGWTRLLAISAALLAQPGAANLLSYQCTGYSEQPGGDRVGVTHAVSQDGKSLGLKATWGPRAFASDMPKAGIAVDLDLQLSHQQPTSMGIGQIDRGILTMMALSPPGTRMTPAWLQRDLAKLKVEFSIDGRSLIAVSWDQAGPADNLPMTASRAAEIHVPAGTSSITITVRDTKGRTINTTHFDLTQTAGRDAQYQIALGAANKAASDYKSCQRIG